MHLAGIDTAAPGRPPPQVAPHFGDAGQQHAAAAQGMWIFLATETLFFGALFFAYAIARAQLPEAFGAASRHTSVVLGTANTAILLTSSFVMALAVESAAHARRRATIALLLGTALLGVLFAGIKMTEYALEYREHLVPGLDFAFDPAHARGARIFFGFYFLATGLHLVHLAIGVALLLALAWRMGRRCDDAPLRRTEYAGLYWHFVDVVWIFLYPCLYLVART